MREILETTKDVNGLHLHFIPNKKYKTITLVLKLKAPLSRDTITKRALIPYILKQGTKKYPSKQKLQMKLDDLYGASISIDGAKKGENHIISLRLEIANQKFLEDTTTILDEGINLLHEILFDPNVTNQQFEQAIFNREKETLRQKINALKDDKMSYANMRLIDEMCNGEPYQLHVHGYEEDLNKLNEQNLFTYYQQMLKEDSIDLYIQGDLDEAVMERKLSAVFHRDDLEAERMQITKNPKPASVEKTKPREVIETDKIQQAKLHIGYRTNITFQDDAYYALHVFNGLFGGFPSSKLFINVREKNSLAYYAASRMESHKGLLLVFSGIAPDDFEKARDIIREQMTAMKQGDFTENELDETKALISNQLLETLDHPQGTIEFLYQQVLSNKKVEPLAFIEQIKRVTKEEVVAVANKLEEDTLYLLTAEKGDSNE
ncbi:MAG: EF-P 5-aminopentanol modification-associated protein YfmF [Bacillota bacterium]|uniref:EF-P 5-aminopentanol modification-associated protein YfmF n=1 Tax=Virgibacillus TaxID=84406 RepID=UPI000EF55AD9|nr:MULTISPECIES: pitrilysin family protein [Virgibacillus]MCC2249218.1 insulinase family protein [Virgibacillus sp. AGTR]QRZ17254.1 insulinase family protein [Virgibacillus sp. AGTR]WBX79514.1 pitrilysin family protein [Virgibacillus salarius]